MIVYLRAGGYLKDHIRPDVDEYTRKVEVKPGTSLAEIMALIDLDPRRVALFMTGGRIISLTYVPAENEVILLRPPVQGG
jgi:sulfur carrier protein ThiS